MSDSSPDSPGIELRGLRKSFGTGASRQEVVRGVDLAIGRGEFFSLLGPSGCGKTTTLRMIAGFETPSVGQILLHGEDVVTLGASRRDVNMVFQNYALFPHLSVFDNVAFGLRRKKRVPSREIPARVEEMLELVQLGEKSSRRPHELSGGQQQRVALARALVNRPRALLLDEPLAALDLKLRQSMQLELKRIQRDVGITFVFVTHDQNEALTMSDRIAVMNNGLVEQVGEAAEIYERPETEFVAGFIGTSNIIEGEVSEHLDDDHVLISTGPQERVVAEPRTRTNTGDRIKVTVRPEKIRLSREPGAADCQISGVVEETVYLGTSTSYTVRPARGEPMTVFAQNSFDSAAVSNPGDTVWMQWNREHTYALAGATSGSGA